jgi:hypothetical protein
MTRTIEEIADDLGTAQSYIEAAEAEYAELTRRCTDSVARISDMQLVRDRLRLELRAALQAAGWWPDEHGDTVRRP